MHRHLLTLILLSTIGVAQSSPASMATPPAVSHLSVHVDYYMQVDDFEADVGNVSDTGEDYDVFYDRLSSDGRWFYEDNYGYVWQPNVAESTPDWRPYADGHWVWTDRGWYWDSDEDFGWATYHYGRWLFLDQVGWIWVPGSQWAPAWVSWRHTDDDDYVGWAPLPPESRFNAEIGFHPWCDSYYDIGPAAFAFIRIVDFGRPSYREYCLPPQQTLLIMPRTNNITNITYVNNVIINYGPQYPRIAQLVQQRAGMPLPNYKLNYAAQTDPKAPFKTSVQANQLNVFAPPQKLKPVATVKPQVSRPLGRAQVDRGWRHVPENQANELRQQFARQSPVPKTLPAKPGLPVKPQFVSGQKGGEKPVKETGQGQRPPGTELKPFVQHPGTPPPENRKLEEQKREAGPPENRKPEEASNKRPTAAEEKKAVTERGGTERPKGEGEHVQRHAESKHAHEAEKPGGHGEPQKGKKEESKAEPPPMSQAKEEHHNPHPEERVAEARGSQHHAEPPKPHPPQQSHQAPPNNQKKKEEHKK
ncbi:MAG: hypothetical protein JOZ61_05425 [Verrucomicrobia bacterium]|nr:hypothetical protein [Verrucomicrobiota bacterium]